MSCFTCEIAVQSAVKKLPGVVQVRAGNCYCEVTNPQGSCCLGNVSQIVKEAAKISPTR